MQFLANLKKLLHILGLYVENEKESFWYKSYGFFVYCSVCVFALPTLLLAATADSVEQFAATLPVGLGMSNGAFKGCYFLMHHKQVKSLLGNVQKTFNAQILMKRPEKHYKAANTTSHYLVNGVGLVYGICGWAAIIGPPAFALVHYFLGTLTDDKIRTPIPALLPYDLASLPVYVATCAGYAVAINFCVFGIAAVDTFFLAMCVSFNGCFNDLVDMFADTDSLLEFSERPSALTENKQRNVAMKDKLTACVKFHNVIHRLIEEFQQLIGPIIFAQYFFTLFQLGTLAFAVIMIPGVQPDVVVLNVVLIVACLTELSIYCYFGSELTSAAAKVSFAVYDCKWYEYHSKLGTYFLMSLIRAQKETHLHGFYLVVASMETFSQLINSVTSAFTLLKSTADG